MAGHGYEVAEKTRVISEVNADALTSDRKFYPLPASGRFQDGVGPLTRPPDRASGHLILEQRFDLKYNGKPVDVSTVLKHTTVFRSGQVSNSVSVIEE